ncbi:MAG: glycosyltransferase [Gemmataceae bacterium]|nr:glycosyltransferase [Gemmataceae bacterium]MCI0743385.1 glycosyltransferase [Gemmataceae bacterium]
MQRLLDVLRDWLLVDSVIAKQVVAFFLSAVAVFLYFRGKKYRAVRMFAAIHSSAYSYYAARFAEHFISKRLASPAFVDVYLQHFAALQPTPQTKRFLETPKRLLGPMVTVLKTSRPDEKGVLLLNYSYVYPLFAKLFDVEQIVRRYHLVLEPSWCGAADINILSYACFGVPVFVESGEPRDTRFLESAGAPFIPVAVAGNWWVDHRVFRPIPDVTKDADVIMVAGWASYKRHARFFAALAKLRRQGVKLKTILVGYSSGLTMADIRMQAKFWKVDDQIEWVENVVPSEVNVQMNRSKVNVLWSRKEGFNRVVMEGMFAGVPCILRHGHNYGYHYRYINEQTGTFATETELPSKLLHFVERHGDYRPREWAMENMSCQEGTRRLNETIKKVAIGRGESWTEDLVVRVSKLNGIDYWDEEARSKFAEDYAFLERAVKPS